MTTVPLDLNTIQPLLPGGSPTRSRRPRRNRRGQTIAEFALTLPILLFMMFGIIEFGRIFQAWVTIQNAARDAARYAITGTYDQVMFPDVTKAWAAADPSDIFPATGTPGDVVGRNLSHGFPCPASPAQTTYNPSSPSSGALFGTDTAGNDAAYRSHWSGIHCNPGDQVNAGLQTDVLRLASIVRQAQIGASGLGISQTVNVPGSGINSDQVGAETTPGWFNVFLCSSRLELTGNPNRNKVTPTTRYTQSLTDWQARRCTITEPDPPVDNTNPTGPVMTGLNTGRNQYDAGGPGDFVHVIIFFNHPLITPISWSGSKSLSAQNGTQALASGQGYIQLQASRTMINESFRVSTVVNLSGGVGPAYQATATVPPTNTLPPTSTSSVTATPTQTITTPTNTPTATAFPLCSNLTINGGSIIASGSNEYLNLNIQNANGAPVYLNGATIKWGTVATTQNPGMFVDHLQLASQAFPMWAFNTLQPPSNPGAGTGTYTLPAAPTGGAAGNGWLAAAPTYASRAFTAGNPTSLQIYLSNASSDISQTLHLFDFGNTQLSFDLGNNTACSLTLSISTLTPLNPTTAGPSPTANCASTNYSMFFTNFSNFGEVRFTFVNNSSSPVFIKGVTVNWVSYFGGMALSLVATGGTTPFDPSTFQVWSGTGSEKTSPTVLTPTYAGWSGSPSMNASTSQSLWLVYSGTTGNLGPQYGANGSDFNGTSVTLSNGCVVTTSALATVLPQITSTFTPSTTQTASATATKTATNTFTPSYTATNTNTPTNTFTPTATFTASKTFTVTNTATITNTFTPTNTRTNTFTPTTTLTPSNTATRTNTATTTNTYTPSNTATITNTPTSTNTYTPTSTPTNTSTASKTSTATTTYTPSNTSTTTNTPTKTATASPTSSPTNTLTKTATLLPTSTPTVTRTPTTTSTATATSTVTPTATNTASVTPSPTLTLTASSTNTPPPTLDQGGSGGG